MNTDIEHFVDCVRGFCNWISSRNTAERSAKDALRFLTALYQSALSLPSPDSIDLSDVEYADQFPDSVVTSEELHEIYRYSSNIFTYYRKVFDPHDWESDDRTTCESGDLRDDLGDIFLDIHPALVLYDRGEISDALWNWVFHFQVHWGRHALSAIYALHTFLADQAPDRLFAS